MSKVEGHVYDMTGFHGYDNDGNQTVLDGLYEVVEYHPYEPSNYVWTACFTIVPAEVADDPNWDDFAGSIDAHELQSVIEKTGGPWSPGDPVLAPDWKHRARRS